MSTADVVRGIAIEADGTEFYSMPRGATPTRPNASVPVALRLPPDDVAAIEAIAAKLEIPVSALLRTWIQSGLASSREETVVSALDRLTADVLRLRALVA